MANVKNKAVFESLPVPKAVLTMAVPTIIGQLIVLIYSIADTFFVGRTNNSDMVAGASLILPVFNILLSISAVAGMGGSSLVSRLLGTGDREEARKVYSFCVYLSTVLSLVFSLGIFLALRPLLLVLGANEASYEYARQYTLCVVVLGGLPTVLTNVFSNMVRSIGSSMKAGFGVTLGGVLNILLDPLFMFAILPEGNEILGAGIATLISNVVSCLYFIVVILMMKDRSVLKPCPISRIPDTSTIGKIMAVGIPAAISTFLFDLDYIVIDRLMSGYDNISLAAIGIVLKAERLPLNIGIGICQGMVPIVAFNYSAKNYKRMRDVTGFSMRFGIICAVLSIILYEIFAPFIMRFFTGVPETVTIGTNFLRVRCLATILMFLSFFHVHLFNSYGRGKEALFLGVMRWAVFNIPMLFLLHRLFGIYGIVWAQLAADILTVALSLAVHERYLRKSGLKEANVFSIKSQD